MDQQKIGCFIKELRKERGLTQEQLAEQFRVSRRTVSRWETASNMPDLDLLIEITDFFEVDLRELLDGERKSEKMDKALEETVRKVADYSNEEKLRLLRRLNVLFLLGLLANIVCSVPFDGYNDFTRGLVDGLSKGLSTGMILVAFIMTSRQASGIAARIYAFKMRIFHRK
jgi:transcriptional regulator with XRE-family HTH domain